MASRLRKEGSVAGVPSSPAAVNNDDVVRLRPYQYVHVHDANMNVTRLLTGPQTYTRLEHEHFCSQPEAYVAIPPNNYCIIENPISVQGGKPVELPSGQIKNRFGYKEVRMNVPPFPLYPGEEMFAPVTPLQILSPLEALRVAATADHDENVVVNGKAAVRKRKAGDEWIINGPTTVIPHVDVQIVEKISAVSVSEGSHLILKAERDFTDRFGIARTAGDQWLYTQPGAFIRDIEETIVGKEDAIILTDQVAIHVRAANDFKDRWGTARKTGEEWLVTVRQCATFMPTPDEKVINKSVALTVLSKGQYCVVINPVVNGETKYGTKELRQGATSFFLHPTEYLEAGIKNEFVLGKDEGLVLYANAAFDDGTTKRAAGDRWMIKGPTSYIPPVEVKILDRRKAIPLDQNEGVYIRNIATGKVRSHIGSTVLLNENEELWNKELPALVEDLLTRNRYTKHLKATEDSSITQPPRRKHKVVTVNVPHNHFVQVYNFESKKARVVRGPELVTLAPDEEFTVISLSGGTPKQSDLIKTLCLFSGPDFATDKIIVETRDHARLTLHLSYNWEFDMTIPGIEKRIFNVPDFVGDCCKAIASKIRSAVAGEPFDQFHLHSNKIIKDAVFGEVDEEENQSSDSDGEVERSNVVSPRKAQRLVFEANNLIITNVDIHSVDPVDQKTSEALTKSVQLAIEITTSSQEADARHQALSLEQAAKGKLERSIIEDKCKAEKTVQDLMSLECENAIIESMGASKAEAQARAQSAKIECESEVEVAKKRVEAAGIVAATELDIYKQRRELELTHKKNMIALEIAKVKGMAEIETEKFKKTIAAIGRETIKNISKAGPETQARLLKGLGLQGYLVTDGSNPINLFNAAKGLTAQPSKN